MEKENLFSDNRASPPYSNVPNPGQTWSLFPVTLEICLDNEGNLCGGSGHHHPGRTPDSITFFHLFLKTSWDGIQLPFFFLTLLLSLSQIIERVYSISGVVIIGGSYLEEKKDLTLTLKPIPNGLKIWDNWSLDKVGTREWDLFKKHMARELC